MQRYEYVIDIFFTDALAVEVVDAEQNTCASLLCDGSGEQERIDIARVQEAAGCWCDAGFIVRTTHVIVPG